MRLASPLGTRAARLEEFAGRWHPLPAGGSIVLSWPLSVRARGSG
jgi:hypothetical protein